MRLEKNVSIFKGTLALAAIAVLFACNSNNEVEVSPPFAVEPELNYLSIKTLQFSWEENGDATHYKLLENADGMSGFTQVGDNILAGTSDYEYVVPLYDRTNAEYLLQSCIEESGAEACSDSSVLAVSDSINELIGYIKASTLGNGDEFGSSVALSGNGRTLAVGAIGEASLSAGINGEQSSNNGADAGAVYIFELDAGTNSWSQQAYIKASNPEMADTFGDEVSLSDNGNVLVVSAPREDSASTGVDGNQSDDVADGSGAAYVFVRNNDIWTQQSYLKASNTVASNNFGTSLSISGDGSTIAVGAHLESGGATGINGDDSDTSESYSGAVYVFVVEGESWVQQAYVKASNTQNGDNFGISVSLSDSGDTLVVGAYSEDSNDTGVNGDQANNEASNSGAAYVFIRDSSNWSQQAYLKASNTDGGDGFGTAVSISGDGLTIAVGADDEESAATGVNGDQTDDSTSDAGAVYVFSRTGDVWNQQAYLKSSNTEQDDNFGARVSLTDDGNKLAVTSRYEDSSGVGFTSNQSDNSSLNSGAVYVFSRESGEWSQTSFLKALNTEAYDDFGFSLIISDDGKTLAVGARWEDGGVSGIGGDPTYNTVNESGAVYLY